MAAITDYYLMGNTLFFVILMLLSNTLSAQNSQPNTKAILKTTLGNITIKLHPDQAPNTVRNFVDLAKGVKEYKDVKNGKPVRGVPFYNGMIFHKVHPELGIQTGCPWGTGRGWPGFTIPDESRSEMKFDRAFLVAMAKIPTQKNSIGSQFFITTKPQPELDGNYPIFGEVIAGFDVVKLISRRRHDAMMKPIKPIKLQEVIIE